MGKECGARFNRRLWGGSNTSPLKTTAWEAIICGTSHRNQVVVLDTKSSMFQYQYQGTGL